ncbi:MFS transporter [Streptomyces sp. NPDC005474]|uniref:MFS transporter n=1 Tax=Streptomyces sp. NPDC005474 TaxID=3154878 RepID=UPI00345462B3
MVSIAPPLAHAGPTTTSRQRLGTLIAACLAVCVAQIGLVLPAAINGEIQQTLHTSGSQLTWISAAFLVPTAILELTFGVLGDLFGRKRLMVAGAVIGALGYLIAATADSAGQLIAGQAISGIGAAALFPSSLALVVTATPDPESRARGLASWTTALSLGAFIAPLLSGAIVEYTAFQWAFAAVGILAVASAAVSLLLAGESSAPQGRSLDWPGQLTIAGALLALLYGIIQGPTAGWGSESIVGAFAMAAALMVAFVAVENRSASPMLRLELFRNPAFTAAAVVAVIGMFGFLGGAYDLSIRVGAIQHQSPLQAAVPFLIIQGITPFVWPLLVRLLRRVSPGLMLVAGFLSVGAGQLWLSSVPISDTALTSILGPLLLNGTGFGLIVSALTAAAVNIVPSELTGMASAATNLVRDFGQTLGPAIIGAVSLSIAATDLAGKLGSAGLTAQEGHIVDAVFAQGGPLAVLSAPLGPASAKVAPLAQQALAHGYDTGLIVTSIACLAAAVISGIFLTRKPQTVEASAPAAH